MGDSCSVCTSASKDEEEPFCGSCQSYFDHSLDTRNKSVGDTLPGIFMLGGSLKMDGAEWARPTLAMPPSGNPPLSEWGPHIDALNEYLRKGPCVSKKIAITNAIQGILRDAKKLATLNANPLVKKVRFTVNIEIQDCTVTGGITRLDD